MLSVARARRALREGALGKAALLAAVLLAALLVSRSCGSSETAVDHREAIEIAKGEIDYEANRVIVRLLKRGLGSDEYWAVSLSRYDSAGRLGRSTVVIIDAQSGEVDEVRVAEP